MITAQVVSPVVGTGDGPANAYRARLVDIPGVQILNDDTAGNAPMAPNMAVYTCAFTPAAFDAVLADPEYLVLWSVDNG